jgi:hypothetical protein
MAEVQFEVTTSGPLFNGSAQGAAAHFLETAVGSVADAGVDMMHQQLGAVLKNPTGYYESRITSLTRGSYGEVNDSNVIYGGWLERGRTGTRFSGYHSFRVVTQQLDAKAVSIVTQQSLPEFLRRLNG